MNLREDNTEWKPTLNSKKRVITEYKQLLTLNETKDKANTRVEAALTYAMANVI